MKEEDKWEIIRLSKQPNASQRAIAKTMKCSRPTVQATIRTYKEYGTVHERPKSGRPPALDDDSLKYLDGIISRHNTTPSHHLATLVTRHTGKKVSSRTVQRARKGVLARHPVHEKLVHSFGEGEKERRVAFARTLLTMNLHYVLWSDEKFWVLSTTGRVHWIKAGESVPTREVASEKASLMVWGCVWWGGKSELCVCERSIDAEYYTEILAAYLQPAMPDSSRYLFQQDNAGPHKAKKTIKWLSDNAVRLLQDWPAYSPDLNPIEHVWSWMVTFVNGEAPTNKRELETAVLKAWDNLPQSVIQGYIGHLNAVCQQIIAAGGDHI